MIIANMIQKLKMSVWSKNLPRLTRQSKIAEDPYNYFSVYFRDIKNIRYLLDDYTDNDPDGNRSAILLETGTNKLIKVSLPDLVQMKSEIIHYRKNNSSTYNDILLFVLDYYTRVLYLKGLMSRGKGAILSLVVSDTKSLSHDRNAILKLILNEYIKLRPSRESDGFKENDILSIIYGRLWYKHIRQGEYKIKLNMILESLVITGDLSESEKVYFIKSKSVNTIVDYEREVAFREHQIKIQKNIFKFIIVLTALLAIIILVLLALAGIVNLESIWHEILEIKPVRFLLKLI